MPPTLIMIDGFEYGLTTITTGGGGVTTSIANVTKVVCDSTVKNHGGFALKVSQDGASATRLRKTFSASGIRLIVGSFYFRVVTAPAAISTMMTFNGPASPAVFRVETSGALTAVVSGGTARTTAASIADSAWHLLDFRYDSSAATQTIDWALDGVAQTQATRGSLTATDITSMEIGSVTSTHNLEFWADDLVVSVTTGDYPIGTHAVLAVVPSGDGTHNAGTNTMEDNAGTDIGSTTAYNLLTTWPPGGAVYLRQATVSTTAYAEVALANADATMTTIWDAQALLAFASSTNAVNEGACMVSSDGFSTNTEIYGTDAARTNYQTASGTTLSYKVSNTSSSQGVIARPGGGWTTATFNALTSRMGYSNDVTGNPRWEGLLVQYAGTISTGETTFAGSIPI